jgi:hypothetical protein
MDLSRLLSSSRIARLLLISRIQIINASLNAYTGLLTMIRIIEIIIEMLIPRN